MEEWKDIKGYEGYYQVSSHGRIKSLDRKLSNGRNIKGKILKPKHDKDGYLDIGLSKNSEKKFFRVHQLVAKTFLNNPNNHTMINHKNGVRDDNHLLNLEWCNNSYNQWHRCHINKNPPNNNYKKKSVRVVLPSKQELEFLSVTECASYFGVTRTAIERKLKGYSSNPSYDLRKTQKALYGIYIEYII